MNAFALARHGKFKSRSIMRTLIPTKMNKTNYTVLAVMVGLLLTSGQALRADIVQSSFTGTSSWGGPDSIVTGQSFTADSSVASLLSIGFRYRDSNTPLSAPSMTIDLFDGVGYGGTLLDSDVVVANTGIGDHWEDFDFSGNTLVSGQTYSFRLTAGPAAGGYSFVFSDPYSGGSWLDNSGIPRDGDMAFRILGVPEPSTLFLSLIGLALLPLWRRNLRRYSN